jgi:hypothetical protein
MTASFSRVANYKPSALGLDPDLHFRIAIGF